MHSALSENLVANPRNRVKLEKHPHLLHSSFDRNYIANLNEMKNVVMNYN